MSTNPSVYSTKKICGKKLSGYSFRKNSYNKNECPADEKRCGSQSTNDYMFCVPKDSKCPIQEVRFEYMPISDASYEQLNFNFGTGSFYYIYVKRISEDKQPIIKFRVSNSLQACESDSE